MNSVRQEELNRFFVETFNKILQYEEAMLSAGGTSGLSIEELHILEAVAQMQARQENTTSRVATRLGVSVDTLTTVVDVLVAKEYLEHRGCEQDRRVVWTVLTPRGGRGGVATSSVSPQCDSDDRRFPFGRKTLLPFGIPENLESFS